MDMRSLIPALICTLAAVAAAQVRDRAADAFAEIDRESKLWPVDRLSKAPVRPPPPARTPPEATHVSRPPPDRPPPVEPPAALDEPIDFAAVDAERMDRAIRDATNRARGKQGLPPLRGQPLLTKAAQAHARRMTAGRFFSHTDPGDPGARTPTDRALAAGIKNPKIAENIALRAAIQHGQADGPVYVRDLAAGRFSRSPGGPLIPPHTYASFAAAIVQQWMDSPGHRRNILAPEALEIGCAVDFVVHDHFPSFNAVQAFQWYEPVESGAAFP